ncbi:hypothetical protein TIFTF001_049066 [Ficus carica]|uniref:Uncharacterized protein n=2 Tax=Ficus carica TaxID=3494 RepID=A0AA88CN58_FICCA|nr:hypothetical protein TIFTF001_049060 [Ficus carica]GMN23134.1 hypothetical protein TIFTF001_049066 [Ficus carica]
MDTVNDSQIQGHLDEFSWDGLKRAQVDKDRAEKLLDIERKFKYVRANADGLIAELHILTQTAKEGVEMMKAMVDRFNSSKAENDDLKKSIKQKNEDITGLITRIVGEYDNLTLKAHYKLLKEYK